MKEVIWKEVKYEIFYTVRLNLKSCIIFNELIAYIFIYFDLLCDRQIESSTSLTSDSIDSLHPIMLHAAARYLWSRFLCHENLSVNSHLKAAFTATRNKYDKQHLFQFYKF